MTRALVVGLVSALLWIGMGAAEARPFGIGDQVQCGASFGKVLRTEPRPGWDEPFYIVEIDDAGSRYEARCSPQMLRPVATPRATPEQSDTGALAQSPAPPSASTGAMAPGPLRPRGGSDPVTRPENPVADVDVDTGADAEAPARANADAPAPDGRYRCHKISPGGQLMDIGDLTMRAGEATLHGMPEGWTVRGVSSLGSDDRGRMLVAFDYRSASGFNDRLDCVRQ